MHTPLDLRLTRSFPNLPFPHVRHGCYLKRGHCAYLGTPEETMENPRTKAKHAWKQRRKKVEGPTATAAGHPASTYSVSSGSTPDSPDIRPLRTDIRPC